MFKHGARSVTCQKILIYIVFRGVRQRSSYPNRCAKYLPSPWGTMLKMRLPKSNYSSFVSGTAFWVQLGLKLACLFEGQKCPEVRENGVFTFPILKLPLETKMRIVKKTPTFISWARPTKFLCYSLACLCFPKNGFSNSTDFA